MVEQINRIVGQTLAPHREVKTAELVNIVELLDDICEMFRAQAQSHRISVSRVGSAATYVKSYPSELRQVFTNLISNAIDAMPQGGQLQLGVSENQNCVTINIEDSGAGIAAEHLHRLFDPFFTTKAEKGTGLGLWITKQICERLGANIGAANRRDSQGACFTLTLKSVDAEVQSIPTVK
jgi:signal transduction histidine kinase